MNEGSELVGAGRRVGRISHKFGAVIEKKILITNNQISRTLAIFCRNNNNTGMNKRYPPVISTTPHGAFFKIYKSKYFKEM